MEVRFLGGRNIYSDVEWGHIVLTRSTSVLAILEGGCKCFRQWGGVTLLPCLKGGQKLSQPHSP